MACGLFYDAHHPFVPGVGNPCEGNENALHDIHAENPVELTATVYANRNIFS